MEESAADCAPRNCLRTIKKRTCPLSNLERAVSPRVLLASTRKMRLIPTIARPVSIASRSTVKIGPISLSFAKAQYNVMKHRRDYHGLRRSLFWRVYVKAMSGTATGAIEKL